MDARIEELKENFAFLEDWQEKYRYMIELGRQLPPMADDLKTEENRVHGCTSRVWMVCQLQKTQPQNTPPQESQSQENGHLQFLVDSDAHIVRGLLAILMQMASNRTPQEIVQLDIEGALGELELAEHLSPSRSNGLFSMVKRMKEIAYQHTR